MCEILLSMFIVGAMETSPGMMTVEYINDDYRQLSTAPVIEVLMVPTEEYLDCWGYVD